MKKINLLYCLFAFYFLVVCNVVFADESCPNGYSYSSVLRACYTNQTVTCPSGTSKTTLDDVEVCAFSSIVSGNCGTYSSTLRACYVENSYTCPGNSSLISIRDSQFCNIGKGLQEKCGEYSSALGACYSEPYESCPTGSSKNYLYDEAVCVKSGSEGSCEQGYSYSSVLRACYKDVELSCSNGWTINTLNGKTVCSRKTPVAGKCGTYSYLYDSCYIDSTITCPTGTSINYLNNNAVCAFSAAVSENCGTYSSALRACYVGANKTCPSGTYANILYNDTVCVKTGTERVVITFNGNDGTVSENSRTINKGGAIGTLPTATRSNYTFDGWYTAKTGGTKISSSTTVSADTTYYAHWTANSVTPTPVETVKVTFDGNGGTSSKSSITVNKGSKIGTLPTATRSSYTFDGWYTAKTGGTKISSSTTVNADTTYYAHWMESTDDTVFDPTIETVKILFDGNGGTSSKSSITVNKGSKLGTLPTATRTDYIFDGWYTAKTGGTKIGSSTIVSENTTYYAHWTSDIDKANVNDDISVNSKTGDVLIYFAWVIGFGAIGYSIYYFIKKKKEESAQ